LHGYSGILPPKAKNPPLACRYWGEASWIMAREATLKIVVLRITVSYLGIAYNTFIYFFCLCSKKKEKK
jgi:hypothetical protein